MRKSIFLKKSIEKLPEHAKAPAKRILDHLYNLETLKLTNHGDTPEAEAIKTDLWTEIQSFKETFPSEVKLLYKEFKKAKLATKRQMEISMELNQAMIELRMLTSNVILADEFKKECLNIDSIAYIKNQMLNGCIPCEYFLADDEYKLHITALSKAVIEAQKAPNFIPNVIDTYQRVMGWPLKDSHKKVETMIQSAKQIAGKSEFIDS